MSFSTYDDFDKTAKDLLKKDFDTETLALKIKTNGPQGLTIDTKVDFFRADNLAATVSGKKKFPQFCVDKFEHKNNSMTLETSMDDLMPGLTLEFKYKQADKVSGSLSGTYKHPSATLTGDLDIVNYGLDASICSGADPVTMGGDISISNGALKNFSLGLGYQIPKQAFLGVRVNDKATAFSTNFLYTVNPDVTLMGSATHNTLKKGPGPIVFGGTYKCNPNTALKFKLDLDGGVGASAKQTIDANTNVVAATTFNLKDPSDFKFGVIASLS